jgi:hypothetical protein
MHPLPDKLNRLSRLAWRAPVEAIAAGPDSDGAVGTRG